MKKTFTEQEILQYLEIPSLPRFIPGSRESVIAQLDKFKIFVKQRRRELAKKYHPDKKTAQLERMQIINAIVDWIQTLEPTMVAPVRPQPVRKVYYTYYTTVTYVRNTSSTDTAGNGNVTWINFT